MSNKPEIIEKIKKSVLREKITRRGGGIEIDLTSFGFKGEKMTAYQNYLGGGMLGKINNDCTIREWKNNDKLNNIAESLSRYFHSLTNPPEDEWESSTFEQLQERPSSAY